MRSADNVRIAILSAFALALHSIEALIPSPAPWLKLGLANIVTLVTLILYGLYPALMVTFIRVILGSLFTGTFLGPAFLLSFGGGTASTLAMAAARPLVPGTFSAVGLSLIGALFHNLAQLAIASVLFIGNVDAVLFIAPFVILAGTLAGALNGFVSELLIANLKKSDQTVQNVGQ